MWKPKLESLPKFELLDNEKNEMCHEVENPNTKNEYLTVNPERETFVLTQTLYTGLAMIVLFLYVYRHVGLLYYHVVIFSVR